MCGIDTLDCECEEDGEWRGRLEQKDVGCKSCKGWVQR